MALTLTEKALLFAVSKHDGQHRDRNRLPFVVHPIRVGLALRRRYSAPALEAAGYLHDVVEDCGVSEAEVRERFGDDVARLVMAVTKIPGQPWPLPQEADEVRLKLADTLDNVEDNLHDGHRPSDAKIETWMKIATHGQWVLAREAEVLGRYGASTRSIDVNLVLDVMQAIQQVTRLEPITAIMVSRADEVPM